MEISLNNHQIYLIIQRFHSKFRLTRKKDNPNPKPVLFTLNDIYLIKVYKLPCIYANDNYNKTREHLVIKYLYKNETESTSLNLLLDEYNDLIYFDGLNFVDGLDVIDAIL